MPRFQVPTLSGPAVTLRLSRHPVRDNATACAARASSPRRSPATSSSTVEVVVPTSLSDAERTAIEQLADATTVSPRAHLGN